MLAESKKTGRLVEFTLDQWRNMETTGHAKHWKVVDAGIVPKVEQIDFAKPFGAPTTIEVAYRINYRKLLDELGVKYNKRITNEDKLKELYEQNKKV